MTPLGGIRQSIDEQGRTYREKRRESQQSDGTPVTIQQTINRNLRDNPDWRYVDEQDLYRSHVYFGGLTAVDWLLDHNLDRQSFDRLMTVFPAIESRDDWEAVFLGWCGFSNMLEFYKAFDAHVVATDAQLN